MLPVFTRLDEYVAYYARETPDSLALIFEQSSLNYAELNQQINQLARAFLAAGVCKGDRVATLQVPHPSFIVAWLATASIGAIWVGLNPRYQRAELEYLVKDAEPVILLTRSFIGERNYHEDVAALVATSASIKHVVIFAGDPVLDGAEAFDAFLSKGGGVSNGQLADARAAVSSADPCTIVYTSGSTGKPKGALLHHYGIAAFAVEQNRIWPVNPHCNLNFLPINHVGSLCDVTMPCLAAGGTLHLMDQFNPSVATSLIDQGRLTIWGSVPSVFEFQMATPEYQALTMDSVQLIVWEGAAMAEATIKRLLAHNKPMATNYSMTESVSSITALPPTQNLDLLGNTVGTAFAGVEIRLIDADGDNVASGEPGEVAIKSPYMFSGYWRRPDETARSFTSDGYFRTGDLAVRRADGHYKIIGRLKEMYKSGGYNVYPREIELVLEAHPAIAVAAVISVPDDVWQEVGIAYVIATGAVTAHDLRLWCSQRLANYKVPKQIILKSELPLLPIGKIDKLALKSLAISA
jgi:acyl-CoA synthetase (AMP-forming)/AMP-acid ligase II